MNLVFLYQQEAELGEFFTLTMIAEMLNRNGITVTKASLKDLPDIKDSKVYITKHVTPELVGFLRNNGNKVYMDMVDFMAHIPHETVNSFLEWHYNTAGVDRILFRQSFLGDLVPNRSYYIPHHYDYRLNNLPSQPINEKATKISFPYTDATGCATHDAYPNLFDVVALSGQAHRDFEEIAKLHGKMRENNFYFGHRDTDSSGWWFKPATKTASAAAVGRNIITNMDKALEDLLPSDYPYLFVEGDFLNFYETKIRSIDKEEYAYGLDCLAKVKDRTNINNQLTEYKNFFEL